MLKVVETSSSSPIAQQLNSQITQLAYALDIPFDDAMKYDTVTLSLQ